MFARARIGLAGLLLGVGTVTVLTSMPVVAAEQKQSHLGLRRWRLQTDENGKTNLLLKVDNSGNRVIHIYAMSVQPLVGWTKVNVDVEPSLVNHCRMPVNAAPAAVWLETSEGQVKLELKPH